MENNIIEYHKLYSVCSEFRGKVDKCVQTHHELFTNFPHGYCNHICIWAYDYLVSKGYSNIEFRIHDPFLHNRVGSHVWLYWNGFSMDFSCDQFNLGTERFESVIVVKTEYDSNGNLVRTRYTPQNVTIANRKSQVLLEYDPLRVLYAFPNSIKERDIIYKELGLVFGKYFIYKNSDTTGAGDIMLNIQSLVKFPIPQVPFEFDTLLDSTVDKYVYSTYGFTKDEISYIEEQI